MYDGVDAGRLPVTAQLVGGYVDGNYRWSDADWARFPHSVKVRIAVFSSTNDGHVLDVEPGNATPAQSVDWVLLRRRAGADPTVYMNSSTWATVRSAFRSRGVAEPHFWVAQYDNSAVIPSGAIGKQYYNNDSLGYDLSVVADYWPGVDPPEDDMPLTQQELNTIVMGARDQVLNHPVGEVDLNGRATGSTVTLGAITARSRAAQADLDSKLNALTAAVARLTGSPVSAPADAAATPSAAATPAQQPANGPATSDALASLATNDAFIQAIADAVAARLNNGGAAKA